MMEKCPFGCLFNDITGKLFGDCRVPYSVECYLHRKQLEKKNAADDNTGTATNTRSRNK